MENLEEEYSVKQNLYNLLYGFKKYAVDPDIKKIPQAYTDAYVQIVNYYEKKYDQKIELSNV
tara:strand:- start:742 stop:927 length:186 start_codon:yes stop_codon:yes gene_type:complete